MLIANRNRNVALLAKQGHKFIHLVVITAHGLEATKITEEELVADWGEVNDYPVEKAINKFRDIAATLGATETAKKLLADINQ